MQRTVNRDLARERSSCRVHVERLGTLLSGGPDEHERRRTIERVLASNAELSNAQLSHLTHGERYAVGLRKAVELERLRRVHGWSDDDWRSAVGALGDDLPTLLHHVMFVPNIRFLCTEEQQREWLPAAEAFEVIGCYAQTEMGHGSNVRALRTTATFLPGTDEFEVHTPSVDAVKWWPGTLGKTANTAMVIARLIIGGVDRGVHNFLVPLRDRATHEPLPGVTVGDLGPKLGYNVMDNGFLRLDRVRIPRRYMAMRYAKVDAAGRYSRVSGPSEQIAYLTMMQVRELIVRNAGRSLGKALTIAVRYGLLRRQGFTADGAAEHQLLDYPMHQHRLLPMLATAYAFHATGALLKADMRDLEQGILRGDPGVKDAMRSMHCCSSGLKALCTMIAAEGIEDARKCCGGHGYLQASGLPELSTTYLQNCTVEGDNFLLPQQVVGILLKAFGAAAKGRKPAGHLAYLNDYRRHLGPFGRGGAGRRPASQGRGGPWTYHGLVAAFEHRAVRLVAKVAIAMRPAKTKAQRHDLWLSQLVNVDRASRAHCFVLLIKGLGRWVRHGEAQAGVHLGEGTRAAARNLLLVFGLYWLVREAGEFLEDGYLRGAQVEAARKQLRESLAVMRDDAIGLVDAFGISDFELRSAIGRFDGDVYNALYASAQEEPLNRTPVLPGFLQQLRRLRAKL